MGCCRQTDADFKALIVYVPKENRHSDKRRRLSRPKCRAPWSNQSGRKTELAGYGFRDGFEGLLPPSQYTILDRASTAGIMQLGGTILGTTNKGHFVAKLVGWERTIVPKEVIENARATLAELGIDGLIVIGGDGSLTTALQLYEQGFSVIGVPKTIDNDLEATAMTFGFYSAVSCVTDALDRLHSTAASHKRAMVLEVMGRHAGWIALHGGVSSGAGCG